MDTVGDAVPAAGATPRVVVLVEGESDRVALAALAMRLGRDLAGDGVAVVAMHGITNLTRHLTAIAADGRTAVGGLYDLPEARHVRRALVRAGHPAGPGADLEALGFFGCDADLEDELIRALGIPGVEEVIEAAGELRSLHLLAGMPAQRDWTSREVLRRFMGSQSGRKARYAALLVEALDLDRIPQPLHRLLSRI